MNEEGAAETIAAVATPAGRGGIGILRISGPDASRIAAALAPPVPPPREAALRKLLGRDAAVMDRGLALYFPAPASFTGEDVLELHAHGAPAVLDELLAAALQAGARMARPGEFTERAFVHGKLDLAQAEAVADLIDAGSKAAARAALASLEGRFSREVRALADELMRLRVEAEALLDFPDEEVATENTAQRKRLELLARRLDELARHAAEGERLSEGFVCVLAGAPNGGKSSLLNALAGTERAIVTEQPGTTRDPVEVDILLDGMPLRLVDTAGLRETANPIEAEGVRRARERAQHADLVLEVRDDTIDQPAASFDRRARLIVLNKIDRSGRAAGACQHDASPAVAVSASTGAGLDALGEHLRGAALGSSSSEAARFSARRRHLDALARASAAVARAREPAAHDELAAEELRRAQNALGEITGQVTNEDLLGAIFSTFCLGK
ncbi:MAG: tRNA uridine-5-carboxymethylaminomethyl(34) synthesis GTPase MnmE [Gammaproteobacteria bacterium]|nr:tRNA uridine-5-carboxymethylaminomethyl(34) synthesis GTPase MnmE [Gammaproteobacteria bacterium]